MLSTRKIIIVTVFLIVSVLFNIFDILKRCLYIDDAILSNNEAILEIPQSPNRMFYVAQFGLGHRLLRNAAAWHLAQRLGMATVRFQWSKCAGTNNPDSNNETSIFSYLFGKEELWLPSINITRQRNKNVLVKNDVNGYFPAQTFKDHQILLDMKTYKDDRGPFFSKIKSDIALYKDLRDRFIFRDQVDQFLYEHDFKSHHVIGLHIRAGNGEKAHFEQAGRGIQNETTFATNLVELIGSRLITSSHGKRTDKPPLLFLATDTSYLIPIISKLSQSLGIRTVVLPQVRVADNAGVTFSAFRKGAQCLLGWQAMVTDMLILSHVDILIAARHSSFTQSIPVSLVFDRKRNDQGPHFCEVSQSATHMSCYDDFRSWLFHDSPDQEWTYLLPRLASNGTFPPKRVYHKSLIHLPDTELPEEYHGAMQFIDGDLSDSVIFKYGGNFNKKYRKQALSKDDIWYFA